MQVGWGASYNGWSFSNFETFCLWIELVFIEEIECSHCSNHFGEAGDFSNLVHAFPVKMHIISVFFLPDTPTLGWYFRHALIIAEKVQKIRKVLHAILATSTSTPLCFHRTAVVSILSDQRQLWLLTLNQLWLWNTYNFLSFIGVCTC